MADATPAPALQSTADTTPYVPISWMAVTACLVAGLFLTLISVFGYSAAFQDHKPLIMPSLLILAGLGVLLSFAARRMIRNSEGTRTGERYASAAWWTCVIGGLGYSAYLFAIEFSIRREAQGELDRWIQRVVRSDEAQNDIDLAYLRTLDPARRTNFPLDKPVELRQKLKAEVREGYTNFRQMDIVRIARRNPGQCEYVSGGLKDWVYHPSMIDCTFTGSLRCPEGNFPVELSLKGSEGRGGESIGRQWGVNVPPAGVVIWDRVTRTGYGWRIADLEQHALTFGRAFIENAGFNAEERAFLYQNLMHGNPNREFWDKYRTLRQPLIAVAGGFVVATPFTPDYFDFVKNQFFRLPDGKEPPPELKAKFATTWSALGVLAPGRRLRGNDKIDANAFVTITDTAIEVRLPCEIPALGTSGDLAASVGRLVLVCDDPEVVGDLKRLRAEANPLEATPHPPAGMQQRTPVWRITRLETDLHEVKVQQQGGPGPPGGPGGPGGPPGMPGG